MIYRLLLGSILTTSVLAGLTVSAYADDTPILDNEVKTECELFNVINGSLAASLDKKILSSDESLRGTPASVVVSCNGTIDIQISTPIQKSGPELSTDATLSSSAQFRDLIVTPSQPATDVPPDSEGNVEGTITINMSVNNGNQPLQPGTYNFSVTLTVVPK